MSWRQCRQCITGLAFDEVKTFSPSCEGCRDKKARGLRTGNEPRPSANCLRNQARLRRDTFLALVAERHTANEIRKLAYLAEPRPRMPA